MLSQLTVDGRWILTIKTRQPVTILICRYKTQHFLDFLDKYDRQHFLPSLNSLVSDVIGRLQQVAQFAPI
jgi:hypothetical protein